MSSGKRPTLSGERRAGKAAPKRQPKPAKSKPARAARRSRSAPARRRRGGPLGWIAAFIRLLMRVIFGLVFRTALIVCLLIAGAVGYYYTTLPPVEALVDGRARGSVTLLDRNGDVFAWRGEQFDTITSTNDVNPNVVNAVVATEDRRFFRHFGVSPRGVASAMRINMREGRGPLSGHGGSTLTQQTAKLLCLGDPYDPDSGMSEAEYEEDCRRTTVGRKIKEAIYAMAMEARYTKEEILTIYLNRAYLGGGARGFAAAAERYFGAHVSQLDPAQSAMLAGLLVAPSRYAPTSSLERAQSRAETVIRLMYEQDYITAAERDEAWAHPAELSAAAEARAGGYFADWVMSSGPDFLTRNTTEDVVIGTTLDQRIQRAAEGALADIFEEKVREGSEAEAAIVVMSADGAVRAMVGGRRSKVSGAFNRATMAKRQSGSSFKPFIYAAALDMGHSPLATVVDEPWCINVPGSGQYCPKNYTRDFKGRVTLADALKDSLNVPAVKVSEAVGRDAVRTVAEQFGIVSDLANGPALALGASETSLLEMTGAYAGILNGGRSVSPYGLLELRIQGEGEALMGQDGGYGERVISEHAARELVWMMSRVIDGGTGGRAKLGDRPAAGKTGTTSAARDAWFVGFTADYVAGVWMGYDDNTPLSGVTGGGLPAEIWHEAMMRVHEGMEVRPLPMDVPQQQVAAPAPQQQQPQQQAPVYQGQTQTAGNQQQYQPQQQQRQPDNIGERILRDVLGTILGGGN
ncbi:PBP1A family penicillin-binding protein [Roseicyclus sp. F158]|uniref:peptidoglycan glycosyltransferase n=1 Tax=Tropicimonas omnivorans TaxID=3075590 RepID=A0ABU3DDQ6_9RHOB|nr:PBP1A family penicillin-binding protein [Roseicyclus sp. F158]MDT0681851.1 PBP1A family penicillin-binding protein [Roseicyclus sp. F158]